LFWERSIVGAKIMKIIDIMIFSWKEKLVVPLIATPNVDKAIEGK
jgi:hypothetical protein